jgi:hypothetical protein
MTFELAFALCSTVAVFGLWCIARQLQGSWIGPGGLLCAVWFFGMLLPISVAGDLPVSPRAYLLVLAFTLVGVVSSSLAVVWRPCRATRAPSIASGGWRALRRAYWLCTVAGIGAPIELYRATASQYGGGSLLDLAVNVTVARYNADFNAPPIAQALMAALYLAAMLGGFDAGARNHRGWRRLDTIVWMFPVLVFTAIMTTKASVIFGAVLWTAGLIAGTCWAGRAGTVRLRRIISAVAVLCLVGFGFVCAAQLLRWGTFDADSALESTPKSMGTTLGYMSVLSHWLDEDGIEKAPMSGGSLTFAGSAEVLGLNERKMGLYEESVSFDNGFDSNIYTAFRGLVEDFTLAGALAFFALLSFVAGWAWNAVQDGKLEAVLPLAAYLAFVVTSPLTSIFIYNTNVLAIAAFGVLVACLGHIPGDRRLTLVSDTADLANA